jgi:transcription elongation factor Elf1
MFDCPRCGEETATLHEGFCLECCQQGQAELDQHNAQFDRWESLTDAQREAEISDAVRLATPHAAQ